MRRIRHILVAVRDSHASAMPGVAKAAQLAQALGARLTLFHAVPSPICLGEDIGPLRHGMCDLDARAREVRKESLELIARRLRRRGIRVSVSVQWDDPASAAIIHEAALVRADLIVAEAQQRSHHGACCDILVVKMPQRARRPRGVRTAAATARLTSPAIPG